MAEQEYIYTREYWSGDSRDGAIVNGDGYHYFRMRPGGKIVEAYELYENDDGTEVVTPLPEMQNIDWISDLGFDDLEALDDVKSSEFARIKELLENS